MDSNIIKKLVIPLLVVVLISSFLHLVIDNDNFFINLTTELLGIIVTVGYVDWIIKLNDKQQWEEPKKRISSRIRLFINTSITNIRVALGFKIDILDYEKIKSNDAKNINSEMIRITREILEPSSRMRIEGFNQDNWKLFFQNVYIIGQEAENILSVFGEKLTPKQYALMIDIQDWVRNTLSLYSVFPDIAGVPDNQLPQAETPATLLKQDINNNTARSLRELLKTIRVLSETLSSDT